LNDFIAIEKRDDTRLDRIRPVLCSHNCRDNSIAAIIEGDCQRQIARVIDVTDRASGATARHPHIDRTAGPENRKRWNYQTMQTIKRMSGRIVQASRP
jgi:hypothetical protein